MAAYKIRSGGMYNVVSITPLHERTMRLLASRVRADEHLLALGHVIYYLPGHARVCLKITVQQTQGNVSCYGRIKLALNVCDELHSLLYVILALIGLRNCIVVWAHHALVGPSKRGIPCIAWVT